MWNVWNFTFLLIFDVHIYLFGSIKKINKISALDSVITKMSKALVNFKSCKLVEIDSRKGMTKLKEQYEVKECSQILIRSWVVPKPSCVLNPMHSFTIAARIVAWNTAFKFLEPCLEIVYLRIVREFSYFLTKRCEIGVVLLFANLTDQHRHIFLCWLERCCFTSSCRRSSSISHSSQSCTEWTSSIWSWLSDISNTLIR